MTQMGTDKMVKGEYPIATLHGRTRRPALSLTLLLSFSVSPCLCGKNAFAESVPTMIRKGNEQYRAGEFGEALKTYEGAAKADPKSLEARFNQGVAAYKAGDVEKAQSMFREVDSTGGNPPLASAARYNLGVIETQRLRAEPPEKPEAALDGLKSAASKFRGSLDLAPGDADAARNLELTRMAIKDLQEQIARQKELQKQMQDLKDQLKENQKEQEEASQQNQERAGDQQSDQEQKQEAKTQQEQVSKGTQEAQQNLDDLQKQTGGGESKPKEEKPEEKKGDDGTPKAERVGEEPSPQEKMEQADEALKDAREKQEQAQEKIEQGDLAGAEKEQKEAADKLKEALEKLAGKPGENQDQQEPQEEPQPSEEQEKQEEPKQQEQQPPPPEQQEGEQMDQKEGEGEPSTDARLGRILEKERRDRELKQQMLKQQRARNRPVDKDW